jgi:hypothetical protein
MADPVFVGGNPRSGTTILGSLIGHHATYALLRTEAVFHCDRNGVPGYVTGALSVEDLRARMLDHYLDRQQPQGRRGLYKLGVTRDLIEDAILDLPSSPDALAAGRFVRRLLDPVAESAERLSWVEMSPGNAQHAAIHQAMLPNARTVHTIRDGRDVAVSLAAANFGPSNAFEALANWGRAMRSIHAGSGDRERVLTLPFDALITEDRNGQYQRLIEFLGAGDDPAMRRFFDEEMTPERAHVGQWREVIPVKDRRMFNRTYRDLLKGLRVDGVTCVEALRR